MTYKDLRLEFDDSEGEDLEVPEEDEEPEDGEDVETSEEDW